MHPLGASAQKPACANGNPSHRTSFHMGSDPAFRLDPCTLSARTGGDIRPLCRDWGSTTCQLHLYGPQHSFGYNWPSSCPIREISSYLSSPGPWLQAGGLRSTKFVIIDGPARKADHTVQVLWTGGAQPGATMGSQLWPGIAPATGKLQDSTQA